MQISVYAFLGIRAFLGGSGSCVRTNNALLLATIKKKFMLKIEWSASGILSLLRNSIVETL